MNPSQDLELIQKIINVINQIRPYLEADGGNIQFVNVTDEYVVNVELQGACSHCAMSTMTLKNGVEEAMRKAIPQIKSVEAINMN